jgi:hypothetical protein
MSWLAEVGRRAASEEVVEDRLYRPAIPRSDIGWLTEDMRPGSNTDTFAAVDFCHVKIGAWITFVDSSTVALPAQLLAIDHGQRASFLSVART